MTENVTTMNEIADKLFEDHKVGRWTFVGFDDMEIFKGQDHGEDLLYCRFDKWQQTVPLRERTQEGFRAAVKTVLYYFIKLLSEKKEKDAPILERLNQYDVSWS